MTRQPPKRSPRGDDLARRRTELAPSGSLREAAGEPEQAAKAAMAHEPRATPSGSKVKLTLTVSLSRAQAERLTARAIREGKNLEALVAEILESASE